MANTWLARLAIAFATVSTLLTFSPGAGARTAPAQSPAPISLPVPTQRLYAVEITTGAKWDTTKPPNQQAFMKEHSEHLKKLRQEGVINMGARYGDKGLLVVTARDEEHARSLLASDPSMQNETFKFTLNEMRVFYPGQVGEPAPSKKAP